MPPQHHRSDVVFLSNVVWIFQDTIYPARDRHTSGVHWCYIIVAFLFVGCLVEAVLDPFEFQIPDASPMLP